MIVEIVVCVVLVVVGEVVVGVVVVVVVVVGNKIEVVIEANGINGKKIEKNLKGQDFISWQSPVGLNRIQVFAKTKGVSGGLILLPLTGNIGLSSIPMNNGANLETASEPLSDASVITRR